MTTVRALNPEEYLIDSEPCYETLADDRRVLPMEKRSEVIEASPSSAWPSPATTAIKGTEAINLLRCIALK